MYMTLRLLASSGDYLACICMEAPRYVFAHTAHQVTQHKKSQNACTQSQTIGAQSQR